MRVSNSILFLLLAIISGSVAQSTECESYLTLHETMEVEGGVMTIDDEAGVRQLKASSYNIGACSTSPTFSSGSQFSGNYSLLGLRSPVGSGNCVTKYISGKDVMESMQAVVIKTNGWLLEPQSIDFDDLDSQVDVPLNEAWMECAAAFGMVSGEVVLPKIQFAANTLLTSKEFLVPQDAMAAMGLALEEWSIPGGEFSGEQLFNCPFGKENPDSARCRMKISFEKPLDTIVLLYGLKQQSYTETDAAMFVSQIDLKCGCRCVSGSDGEREVALPLQGMEGQCSRIETNSPRTQCDVLGKQWCSTESSFAYKITGEQLQNGNYPCYPEAAFTSHVLSDFNPTENFLPAI